LELQIELNLQIFLLGSPTPIHIPGYTAHIVASFRAEEHGQLTQFFWCCELHGGFFFT
jgi:hypothetical protein